MFEKPTRLIVIVAATLALAACQQKPKQSEEAPAAMQPAPVTAPQNGTETQAAAPAMTAESAKQASPTESAGPAMTAKPSESTAMKQAETKSTIMTAESAPTPPAPAPKPPAPAPTPPPAPPAPAPLPPAPAPAPPPTAESFNTAKCKACHGIDHDKVGPAWKTVVEKYGDAATLARDFESGFKERRVANSIAKWKSKESLMTSQFNSLIKGHEKAVAHALFESVKQGKFGDY